jgi:predicted enzyme related to lactoylglutathione lyase
MGRLTLAPADSPPPFKATFKGVTMQAHSLSAVVFTSSNPDRLAAFYNQHLGLGFARRAHGPGPEHHEASLGGMRFAIVPGAGPAGGAHGVSPTFLVNGLDGFVQTLQAAGVDQQEPTRSLGEGKRLALYRDIDGNAFQLIDLGFAV